MGGGGIFWFNPYMQKELGIVINACTAEPGYWQKHFNYILAINELSRLCEQPSAVPIEYDVKCHVSTLNFSLVLLIIYINFIL